MFRRMMKSFFTRENLLAIVLGLLLALIVLFGTDTAPTWIYQGF